jgi:cobalt-zinc-cadmium efflux system protein
MSKHIHHHHHNEISEKSVKLLFLSFIINILLSIAEVFGGIVSGSVALIGDALHNTSDAFSILIAVIAFKIGNKKASAKYTYGFKRAEVIGGFVNLILLFISGCYLLVEGGEKLINPQKIDGTIIIWISVLALIIDVLTAKISHHDAQHNSNMKMVFIHNLADAFGSIGVIISGFSVIWFGLYRIDGIVALLIAFYMIFQSVASFPKIVNILMNAAPDNINIEQIKTSLLSIENIKNVYHVHVWCINEHDVAIECHIESDDTDTAYKASRLLKDKFGITHCNFQVESKSHEESCNL